MSDVFLIQCVRCRKNLLPVFFLKHRKRYNKKCNICLNSFRETIIKKKQQICQSSRAYKCTNCGSTTNRYRTDKLCITCFEKYVIDSKDDEPIDEFIFLKKNSRYFGNDPVLSKVRLEVALDTWDENDYCLPKTNIICEKCRNFFKHESFTVQNYSCCANCQS